MLVKVDCEYLASRCENKASEVWTIGIVSGSVILVLSLKGGFV